MQRNYQDSQRKQNDMRHIAFGLPPKYVAIKEGSLLDFKPPTIVDSELILESRAYVFHVANRPAYCDRGRYMVYADNKDVLWNPIDGADFFPRYYFSLENLVSELEAFVEIREKKIDFSQTFKT